ncbi:methyltransferase [Dolichospermum compactum]|uniref:O-methyltransferase family 2 n=1 Tax=Dolichospermum compactum NIES-806 TaxID=1973481 RepID=A0A1Z4UXU5_9CYAN|nr:methyltransferase [Dolichospermum compactum]BAZ84003.1 O-methyltransferase family 2 [Dolichospermum compactum NIES-806]
MKITTVSPQSMDLMQMLTGYWVSQSIYAAAKLGIADYITDEEKSYIELANTTQTHEESLYRLLRALASVGIFIETSPGYFATTPMANLLRSDVPDSLRDVGIMLGDIEHQLSWGNIVHAVKTGESGFEKSFGMNLFDYYCQNPEAADIFDRSMTGFSKIEAAGVITDYNFTGINSLVDVGGGMGSLLTSILQAYPQMTGILFDLPHVIERAKLSIANKRGNTDDETSDRYQLVSGSFFEPLPPKQDAYLLKHIIHDWDDEKAIAILQQCRQAMAAHSKVLVVESVIPSGNEPFPGKFMDVNMLVMCTGGKERTAEEFFNIFKKAQLELVRIVPTRGMVSVVEGQAIGG